MASELGLLKWTLLSLFSSSQNGPLNIYIQSCYSSAWNPPEASHFFQSKIQSLPWPSRYPVIWFPVTSLILFTAVFYILSLSHLLLPQGLCTSAAGSPVWRLHVSVPCFIQVSIQGLLIRNTFPEYSISYSIPKYPTLSSLFLPFYVTYLPPLLEWELHRSREFDSFIHYYTSGRRLM